MLDMQEFQRSYRGQSLLAQNLFGVIDTDGDNQINVLEKAAYLMFQDTPLETTNDAIDGNEQTGLPTADQADQFRRNFEAFSSIVDSRADGKVTVKERLFADITALASPTLTTQALEGMQGFISEGL